MQEVISSSLFIPNCCGKGDIVLLPVSSNQRGSLVSRAALLWSWLIVFSHIVPSSVCNFMSSDYLKIPYYVPPPLFFLIFFVFFRSLVFSLESKGAVSFIEAHKELCRCPENITVNLFFILLYCGSSSCLAGYINKLADEDTEGGVSNAISALCDSTWVCVPALRVFLHG